MNYQKNSLKILLLGCAILFWTFAIPVKAQFVGIKIREVAKTTQPRTETVRTIQKVVNRVQIVKTTVMQKTSNLSVTTEPGATVSLIPKIARQKKINPKIVGENGSVTFEDLPPTLYSIRAEKSGFVTVEQDDVKILAQQTQTIDMDLKQITYNLSIETNINDGEVRYAPAVVKSVGDGKITTEESDTEAYCIAPLKNKKAVIKGLKNGYYNIDIRPSSDEIQYEPLFTAVKVSDETIVAGSKSNELQTLPLKLETKISKGVFTTTWLSDEWNLTSAWKLNANKTMKTNGLTGIALPKNDQYSYYTDFEMMSDVRLLNADTIGFIVRAEDKQNYYLFQISGAKAETPHVIKFSRIKDGKEEPPFSQSISPFAQIIAEKNFRVIIQGKGNAFSVFIEDTVNGRKALKAGEFIDQYSSFRKGALGLAGTKNSNFEVASFTICALQCN